MKRLKLMAAVSIFLTGLACAGEALAGEATASGTTIGVAVAGGENSSQAYDLYVTQVLEPFLGNETISLNPLLEAGLQAWDRSDKTVWGANGNLGLGVYLFPEGDVRPFVMGTFGYAHISGKTFGNRNLGTHSQFRTRGSLGIDFGEDCRHTFKINFTHYSNGGMAHDNDGYNTIGGSYGFTF